MPTVKKRINITVDDELALSLNRLSKKENQTLSAVCLQLIERALELEEDLYFSRKADQRIEKDKRRVSHKKAWE
jgi:predicted DNA-binding protein